VKQEAIWVIKTVKCTTGNSFSLPQIIPSHAIYSDEETDSPRRGSRRLAEAGRVITEEVSAQAAEIGSAAYEQAQAAAQYASEQAQAAAHYTTEQASQAAQYAAEQASLVGSQAAEYAQEQLQEGTDRAVDLYNNAPPAQELILHADQHAHRLGKALARWTSESVVPSVRQTQRVRLGTAMSTKP